MSWVPRAAKEERKKKWMKQFKNWSGWFFFFFFLVNVLFWCRFPCLYPLLSPFRWWWPPLAAILPLLLLVAVVLVLDMWSVLGVAPVVSSWRVGVACELISDYASFLHLCVSPYFPAHLGSRIWQEGRCHRWALEINRTDFEKKWFGETIYSRGVTPI